MLALVSCGTVSTNCEPWLVSNLNVILFPLFLLISTSHVCKGLCRRVFTWIHAAHFHLLACTDVFLLTLSAFTPLPSVWTHLCGVSLPVQRFVWLLSFTPSWKDNTVFSPTFKHTFYLKMHPCAFILQKRVSICALMSELLFTISGAELFCTLLGWKPFLVCIWPLCEFKSLLQELGALSSAWRLMCFMG